MSPANVAIEYRILVRYSPDMPESALDSLIHTVDRDRMPQRLLNALNVVLQRFPGLLVEIYEDHGTAPVISAITGLPLRRTGT